jgi:hypothetical protein
MALKDQVPGILELSIGPNISPGRDLGEFNISMIIELIIVGYTHALRVLVPDEAALKAYAVHPAHQEFVKILPFDKRPEGLSHSACIDWKRD